MEKLFRGADRWIAAATWKDLALVKLCLCAIGVLIGLAIPKEKKKLPLAVAALVFIVTYIPLMGKFLGCFNDDATQLQD